MRPVPVERFLCLVLPNWSTDRVRRRLARAERGVNSRTSRAPAVVLTARARGGGMAPVVARVCERARAAGVEPGATLALARGLLLHDPLHVEIHDPDGDAVALLVLARAAQRFTPRAAVSTAPLLPGAKGGSTARKSTVRKSTAHQDAVHKNAVRKNTAHGSTAHKNTAHRTTARPTSTPDALVLEIGGSLRLFGGERALVLAALDWLTRHGVAACAGVASTIGAAQALAHALALARPRGGADVTHSARTMRGALQARGRGTPTKHAATHTPPLARAAPGAEHEALAPLPLTVLRLSEELLEALHELGLATIGDVLALPRHEVPARLGDELIVRLDQALGRAPEGLARVAPPLEFERTREFAGALESRVVLARVVRELVDELVAALAEEEHVCARLELRLWPSDAAQDAPPIALVRHASRAGRDAKLLWALFEHELEHAPIGFGVERVQLIAGDTARARESEHALLADGEAAAHARAAAHASDLAALVDVLRGRLGPGAAFAADLCADVRAECCATPRALDELCTNNEVPSRPRPTRLFDPPRPIEVLAVDGRPRWFTDGGQRFELVHVDGPERLALPWWPSATRSRAAAAPALLARTQPPSADLDGALTIATTALRHQRDVFRARDSHGRLVWLVRAVVVDDALARDGVVAVETVERGEVSDTDALGRNEVAAVETLAQDGVVAVETVERGEMIGVDALARNGVTAVATLARDEVIAVDPLAQKGAFADARNGMFADDALADGAEFELDILERDGVFDLDARLVALDRNGPSHRVQAHDVAFAWYLHGEWC